MKNKAENLWLENQICFPLYATSRLITKLYTPLLDTLDITYPQYLVLLVLWKEDNKTVSDISEQLILDSNTLTPLLKRMEKKQLIHRKRSETDERKVVISLTEKGIALKEDAACIPTQIFEQVDDGSKSVEEARQFKDTLDKLMQILKRNTTELR